MSESLIKLEQVYKRFRQQNVLPAGVKHLLLQLPNYLRQEKETKYYEVLKHISLEIVRGEAVGFIGENGVGKSTLLRIIAGVITPSSGKVTVKKRVTPVLGLGSGFKVELSGIENIFLNGILLGMTRTEVRGKLTQIIAFSELGNHIDQPIRTYSSGMQARLGFSIAAHLSPEILLIDEVLSVGDLHFNEKCRLKINEFRQTGVTLLVVSHSLDAIKKFCARTVWLEAGKVKMDGDTNIVCEEYRKREMKVSGG